jgi:PhoD-like phosphatase
MPIRQISADDKLRIWRNFRIGRLLDLTMLDTRQYDRDLTDVSDYILGLNYTQSFPARTIITQNVSMPHDTSALHNSVLSTIQILIRYLLMLTDHSWGLSKKIVCQRPIVLDQKLIVSLRVLQSTCRIAKERCHVESCRVC